MNLSLRTRESVQIVEVDGDVDLRGSPIVRKTLFDALKASPNVAVNLTGVRYIDSSGIAVLIEALRESQRLRRRFLVFGANARVREVFRLTHVNQIFQVFDDEEQALASQPPESGRAG